MNRRNFLSLFGASVAGIALEQAIPFNRVWSFPKDILISHSSPDLEWVSFSDPEWVSVEMLRILKNNLRIAHLFNTDWEKDFATGSAIAVKIPQRFTVAALPQHRPLPS